MMTSWMCLIQVFYCEQQDEIFIVLIYICKEGFALNGYQSWLVYIYQTLLISVRMLFFCRHTYITLKFSFEYENMTTFSVVMDTTIHLFLTNQRNPCPST